MAHAVLLGTGICGRFSLLMRGGLLTRIPSLLGLCEIKTKRGLQFHAFFFFPLYTFGEPVCSDL